MPPQNGYGTLVEESDNANEEDEGVLPLATSQHLGASRQYWRDIILGVNDGLISTFLLVVGVAGGGLDSNDILLTAIAGALAGAVSMFAGEFVATKSQNEVMQGEISLEKKHIKDYIDDEMSEVGGLLDLIGIPQEQADLRERLLAHYRGNPESLLKIMVALELGALEDERRSPMRAGLTSGALFLAGSIPSVLPFVFSGDRPEDGLAWAVCCTTLALLLVGAVKTWATRGNSLHAALENLVIAGLGGGMAYGVGVVFDILIRH